MRAFRKGRDLRAGDPRGIDEALADPAASLWLKSRSLDPRCVAIPSRAPAIRVNQRNHSRDNLSALGERETLAPTGIAYAIELEDTVASITLIS